MILPLSGPTTNPPGMMVFPRSFAGRMFHFFAIGLFFASAASFKTWAAGTEEIAALKQALTRSHWSWVPGKPSNPPLDMSFYEDGTGKAERFSFTWSITSWYTVSLVTSAGTFNLTFNQELTAYEARQKGDAMNLVSGTRVTPGQLLQPAPRDFIPGS